MKNRFLAVAVMAVVVVLAACGGKTKKSNECTIEVFAVDGKEWSIQGQSIIGQYQDKSNLTNVVPVIVCSEGAFSRISPPIGPYDFSVPGYEITITVTAEDGTTNTYKAKVSVN